MVESYRGSEGEGWVAPEPEDTRTLSIWELVWS